MNTYALNLDSTIDIFCCFPSLFIHASTHPSLLPSFLPSIHVCMNLSLSLFIIYLLSESKLEKS